MPSADPPSATLAHLVACGAFIVFRCGWCNPKRRAVYQPAEFAAMYGLQTTFEQLRRRASCQVCGTRTDGPRGYLVDLDIDVTRALYAEMRAQGLNVSGGFGHDRR